MVREILCSPASNTRVSECPNHGLLVTGQEGPYVQPKPPLTHKANYGWLSGAQVPGQGFRVGPAQPYGEGGNLVCRQRPPAAAGYRRRHVHLKARRVAPEVLGEVDGPFFYLGDRCSYHTEGREIVFGRAIEIRVQRRFQGGEAQLVGAESAGEGMVAHGGGPTRSSYRYPCLRPAEEFVSREDCEVSAISQGMLHPWFFTHG